MSLGILLAVFDDSLEHARVHGHDGRLESDVDVAMLMWRYLHLLGFDFKCELLDTGGSLLPSVELDCAWNFVVILDLEFLHYSVGYLGWYESAEVKYLLLDVEHVRVYHVRSACTGLLAGHYHLFFEDCLEIFGVDAWNARFGYQFVQDTLWLILGIAILNIQTQFLLVEFLATSSKRNLDSNTTIGSNRACRWVNRPLSNL